MGQLSIRTRSWLGPSHLPGPALSKSGIPGKCEETDVFLIGIPGALQRLTIFPVR